MRRSFVYRLYPSKGQAVAMEGQLESCRRLYNACLWQRQLAYALEVKLGSAEQSRQLVEVRETLPEYLGVNAQVLQEVVRRLDLAFQAFFRRCKTGEAPGYPRFKARGRFDSLVYKQPGSGSVKVEGTRVSFSKLASNVRMVTHRPMRGTLCRVTVKRSVGKWFAVFSCDDVPADPALRAGVGEVGIDVGLTSFATLSTGEEISNPRFARKARAQLRSAQRRLSRRVKGSNRRRKARVLVAKLHEHVHSQRRDHHFKVARGLVQQFSHIGVEKLQVKNMVQNGKLAYSISDAGWSQFVSILGSKAEEAGCTVVSVNPRGTSQECSGCGAVVAKALSVRVHDCTSCGLVLGRDHNAAINIRERARTAPSWRQHSNAAREARSPAL